MFMYIGKLFLPTVPLAWSCTHLPGSWRAAPGRSPVYLKSKRGRQVGSFQGGWSTCTLVQLHTRWCNVFGYCIHLNSVNILECG